MILNIFGLECCYFIMELKPIKPNWDVTSLLQMSGGTFS